MTHRGNETLDVPSGAFKLCLKRLRLDSFADAFRANHSRIGTSVSTDKWNFMKVTSLKHEVIKHTWHRWHRCWGRS